MGGTEGTRGSRKGFNVEGLGGRVLRGGVRPDRHLHLGQQVAHYILPEGKQLSEDSFDNFSQMGCYNKSQISTFELNGVVIRGASAPLL